MRDLHDLTAEPSRGVMNPAPAVNEDATIRALVDPVPIKVWSYLATVFGDLAGEPGSEISGVVLSALTGRVGIRPAAMRVALHRLRKEDWIVARRAGRNGLYRLSERGLAETRRASARIYARAVAKPDLWHVLIADPAAQAMPAGLAAMAEHRDYLKISATILLGTGPCPPPPGDVLVLEFTRGAAPAWVPRNALPLGSEAIYMRTAGLLTDTGTALGAAGPLTLLDRTTVRLLAIHHWRRAVLRHSPLVEMLQGDEWSGAVCRAAVSAILDRLPRPAEGALLAEIQATG